MSGEGAGVNEDLQTEGAFLWFLVVLSLLVPVQVPLSLEYLPTVTEQLLLGLHLPVGLVDLLVLREVTMSLETFTTYITL